MRNDWVLTKPTHTHKSKQSATLSHFLLHHHKETLWTCSGESGCSHGRWYLAERKEDNRGSVCELLTALSHELQCVCWCWRLQQLTELLNTGRMSASTRLCVCVCMFKCTQYTATLKILVPDVSVCKHIWQLPAFLQMLPPAVSLGFLAKIPFALLMCTNICADCVSDCISISATVSASRW